MFHLEITLDDQAAQLLDLAAVLSQLAMNELAAQIITRDMYARTGWPGNDGLKMRKALSDIRSGGLADN